MNPSNSEYEVSIGEHDEWKGLEEVARMEGKAQVRRFLRRQFDGLAIPWNLDLSTLAFLTGQVPSSHAHTTIPDTMHRAALRAWLLGLNTLLLPDQQLWLEQDATVSERCCAFRNGEWHACTAFELLIGTSAAKAKPWVTRVTVKNKGIPEDRLIPISIQATWTCMVEDDHMEPEAASTMSLRGTPVRSIAVTPTPAKGKGESKAKSAQPRAARRR